MKDEHGGRILFEGAFLGIFGFALLIADYYLVQSTGITWRTALIGSGAIFTGAILFFLQSKYTKGCIAVFLIMLAVIALLAITIYKGLI